MQAGTPPYGLKHGYLFLACKKLLQSFPCPAARFSKNPKGFGPEEAFVKM